MMLMTFEGLSPRWLIWAVSSQTRIEYCAYPEHIDVCNARKTCEPVAQLQAGEITEKQRIVCGVGRGHGDDLQNGGRFLLGRHALLLHGRRAASAMQC